MKFMQRFTPFVLFAALMLVLSGCHSLFGSDDDEAAPKTKSVGKRVAVLGALKKLTVDSDIGDFKPQLPPAQTNKDWAQAGGTATHSMLHSALNVHPHEFWHADIGSGSDGDFRILSQPIISGDRVYTLDARGLVTAFATKNGNSIWEFDTTPRDRDGEAMGGGISIADNILYVTTGFGEVLALKATNGHVVWRKLLGKPIRGAPTIADGRVFVITIDNEMDALSTKNGEVLWHHNGIAENATLMGASSPAVIDDSVVVAYSSGEIFNLRTQNGRVAWTDVIAVPAQVGALPAIADIRGMPVIDQGVVYGISHSGRIAAIDQRSGNRIWDADIGGTNTPAVVGDMIFVLSNGNELIALTRSTGRIAWIKELQRLEDPEDRDSTPVFWWGPVLAANQLWLTNSLGHLAAFAAVDGKETANQELADAFFIPPVVANNALYVVSDNGRLIALR